ASPRAPRTLAEARDAKAPARDAGPPPVAFGPQGREVLLVFDHVQERGVASLVIRNVPEASVRATGATRGEKLVVTGSGLAVRNERTSRADYSIVIPTRYRVVRVRIAKQPDRVIGGGPSKREWLWSIPLNASALR
ncbi:MAG: hypothetical protein JWM27_4252, partial [Gemmatimonadetes bacterium]|nr:hypothetical protein [Gemmatimonadota bacterium]